MCRSIKTLRGAEPPATEDEVRAAQAVGYVNAGTVEFLLNGASLGTVSTAPYNLAATITADSPLPPIACSAMPPT